MARVVSRPVKDLLVVGSEAERRRVKDALGEDAVHVVPASTGAEALAELRRRRVDAVVFHADLPDMSAAALTEQVAGEPDMADLPLILYADQPLVENDEFALENVAGVLNLWQVGAPERLLDQTALLLHFNLAKLSEEKRQDAGKLAQKR